MAFLSVSSSDTCYIELYLASLQITIFGYICFYILILQNYLDISIALQFKLYKGDNVPTILYPKEWSLFRPVQKMIIF